MGEPEQFSFPGWNGETVHGFVVKPANFDPAKKYPVAFLIHGGPQGSFNNSWSYRWNAAGLRQCRLRRGDGRFPRLDRLRPGLHRRDQPALGRPPAGRPAEGLGLRDRQVRLPGRTAPAPWAPRTAAT
jgi:hypothetical protein